MTELLTEAQFDKLFDEISAIESKEIRKKRRKALRELWKLTSEARTRTVSTHAAYLHTTSAPPMSSGTDSATQLSSARSYTHAPSSVWRHGSHT